MIVNSILKLLHFAYSEIIMSQITEDIINIENLIKQDPKNFINYFNLGNAYRKLGKYELSLKNFLKSVEFNRDFYQGYNNIGNIYKEFKDAKNSIEYFKKAIDKNKKPENHGFGRARCRGGYQKRRLRERARIGFG